MRIAVLLKESSLFTSAVGVGCGVVPSGQGKQLYRICQGPCGQCLPHPLA